MNEDTLAELIEPGPIEERIFGTRDRASVAAAIEGAARSAGEPVRALFYEASTGAVAGIELAGGRRVVVKAQPIRIERARAGDAEDLGHVRSSRARDSADARARRTTTRASCRRYAAGAARKEPRVLNETPPYACVRCGKPFGTLKAVEAMLGKLAGHAMFQGAALERLKMCGDCRVIDIYSATDESRITDH